MEPKTELSLDEMLADPIVRMMMRRDGVEEAHVRALLRRVAGRLRQAEPRSFAAWPRATGDHGADDGLVPWSGRTAAPAIN
ncbi:MAG TPA: hypothetical protein VGM25_07790 [Caulobacteraceae bacterium]|jgi:hypothetical protein